MAISTASIPHAKTEILAALVLNSTGLITSVDCPSTSPLNYLKPQHRISDTFPELMEVVNTELMLAADGTQSSIIAQLPNSQSRCLVQVQRTNDSDTPYLVSVLADHFSLGSVQHRQRRTEIITRSLYNSHLDALVTIDSNSIIHEFSPSAETLFGYAREEAIGQHVADIVIPPNMHTAHNEGMGRFHVSRTGPVINNRIEIEAIRRNGETFPCELTVVPTEEYNGTTYFTASIRDISDSKAREAALNKAKEIAEASNDAKSRFLAHMSHEIRSPLNAVIGCMDLLLDSGLTDEQLPLAETSLEAGHGLLGIIEDVLDFSKIEAGQQKVTPRAFNLVELCEQVSEVISIRAGAKEINIGCCVDPRIPAELISDSSHIRRILNNLMDNAVKFTDVGGVILKVMLGDKHPEHKHLDIIFTISDTGIGIPTEKQGSLFQEFSQVDNSDTASYGGTGLGLAICRDLANLLGGRISIKSEANSGTTFKVVIPFTTTENHKPALTEFPGKASISVLSDNISFRQAISEQCHMLDVKCNFIDPATLTTGSTIKETSPFAIVDTSSSRFSAALQDIAPNLGISEQNILLYARPYAPDVIIDAKSHGFVHVLQRPFKTSSFIQRLNMIVSGKEPTTTVQALKEKSEEEARNAKKILLAEDNPANQLVAKTMLNRAGYQVDIANNGLEAVAALSQGQYDLVLMDVRMPKLDGISATQQIRSSGEKWASIPIIAMTANAFHTDIERCLASGMNAFLPKPVNRTDFLDLVAKFSLSKTDPHPGVKTKEHIATPNREVYLDDSIVNRLIADTSAEAAAAIMTMFVQELEKFKNFLECSGGQPELKLVREMAHSCKSSAGYCGAVPFQELAQNIETACDLQDHAKLSNHLLLCDGIITRTIKAINQFLADQ